MGSTESYICSACSFLPKAKYLDQTSLLKQRQNSDLSAWLQSGRPSKFWRQGPASMTRGKEPQSREKTAPSQPEAATRLMPLQSGDLSCHLRRPATKCHSHTPSRDNRSWFRSCERQYFWLENFRRAIYFIFHHYLFHYTDSICVARNCCYLNICFIPDVVILTISI